MIRTLGVALLLAASLPMLGNCDSSTPRSESSSSVGESVSTKYNWLQFGGESTHSGNNALETQITPQNVAGLTELFQISLPGNIEGAPAILTNVSTPTGVHDIAFVTTKNGWTVALDAYFGTILWQMQPANNGNITMSSPAIDPSLAYVYSPGLDGFVHKYAVGTGVESLGNGWPELLTLKPTVEKDGTAATIATVGATSYLYMGTGGYDGDGGDYQGHLTAINLTTGVQKIFNTLCSNQPNIHFSTATDCAMKQSGIWAKAGVTFDPLTQMLYVGTGNGLFSPTQNAWGDSILKLNPDGSGGATAGYPVDSYTPSNFQALQNSDLDLGSTNALILAHQSSRYPHLAALSGKDAVMRLVNLDNMSGAGAPGKVAGELSSTALPTAGEVQNPIATWVNPADGATWVYVVSPQNGMNAFQLAIDAGGNPSLVAKWSQATGGGGAAIIDNVVFDAVNSGTGGTIQAFNPTTGAVLWSSATLSTIHWQTPMAANGVIYVGDNSPHLTAYSLEAALPRTGWTATASLASSTAGNAIDGTLSTRWTTGAAQAPNQWFELNMGSPQTFNLVSINANSSDYPAGYEIFVSTDGTHWGSAISSGNGSASTLTVGFPQVTAQYIQVVQTSTSPQANWWSIAELSVYDGPLSFGASGTSDAGSPIDSGGGVDTGTPVDSGADVAAEAGQSGSVLPRTGWIASASASGGGAASNALDGNENTRFSIGAAEAAGQWFEVNMASAQTFDEITIDAGPSAGDYPAAYTVSVSTNGTTWAPVAMGTGSTQLVTVTFPQQTAQYVQVTLTGTSPANHWWSIAEFNVYSAALEPDSGSPDSGSAPDSSVDSGDSGGSVDSGGALAVLSRTTWVASASAVGGGAAANAVDGNENTRWSTGTAQAAGQWFEVNMQSAVSFSEITIDAGGNNGDYPFGYAVSVSTNGTSWAQVASGTGSTQLITVTFPQQTAQYIRVTQTLTGATTNWWSISEFNVYSANPPPGTPIALSRAAWIPTASSSGGGAPANALDGSESTRWSTGAAQAAGQSFEVDLGSAQTFNEVTIDAGPSNGDYPAAYTVSVSTNGTTWAQVATGTGSTQLVTVTFPQQTAQYIEIVQTGTSPANDWWSIAELNVWAASP